MPNSRDRGASLVEYALLVALIAVVSIGAVTALGSSAGDSLESVDFDGTEAPISFTLCGMEDDMCTMTGTHTVRYGSGGTWVEQVRTGDFWCHNSVFGDPVPGIRKQCEIGDD